MICRRRILACGAALALGASVGMPGGARAQEPDAPGLSVPVVLELHEAPLCEALEMLFKSCKVMYVIAPDVQGHIVTLNRTRFPNHRRALDTLLRRAELSLTCEIEGGVYVLRGISDAGSLPGRPGTGEMPDAPSLPPIIRAARRVSGILQKEKGPSFAIIETGGRMPDRSVEVVQIGSRVDGGIALLSQLTVESITATQIVLRARDKQAIAVRLSDLASSPTTWQTWGTTQETKERKR